MSAPQTILVTGANGFVGTHLTQALLAMGLQVNATSRSISPIQRSSQRLTQFQIPSVGPTTDWRTALDGVDCVVHLAARVHIMKSDAQSRGLYYDTNTLGTSRLARCAAEAGVRLFIYLSSIKVNGEQTMGKPFTAADVPAPGDDYGKSKLGAEQQLFQVAVHSQMTALAIRPPLIYGPRVRANFLRLLTMVDRGFPLPLGAVRNARSLVSVWNLCDLICTAIQASALKSGVLMVSDGVDLSTPDLIRRLAIAMERSSRLVSVPESVLNLAGAITGKRAEVSRLCGSLTVDISETKRQLQWTPPLSIDEGLTRTAHWYLNQVGKHDP